MSDRVVLGSISGRWRSVLVTVARAVGTVVGVVAAYFVLPHEGSSRVAVRVVIGVLLLLVVVAAQVRAVFRSPRAALRAVEALAVMVPLLVVVSASIYRWVSSTDPAAFSEELDHVGALYLAMMTMTTVGFGDIAADSHGARIAVMLQMVLNVIVLGVAVKLVGSAARAGARAGTSEASGGAEPRARAQSTPPAQGSLDT